MEKTVHEPARNIKVFQEAEVVVVGGGAAGIAAAVAAGRNGAKTILLERYGHLGGLASGGLVTLIMPMSDGTARPQIAGICQEVVDRLDAAGAALHPRMADLGSDKPELITFWKDYSFCVIEGRLRLSVFMDPEMLKCVLNDMAEEAGVKLLLHSFCARALVEDDAVRAVVFESKSGRQAVLGKVIIDASGDGDVFASAGAPFEYGGSRDTRSARLALVFRIGNINAEKFFGFRKSSPQAYGELIKELEGIRGFTMFLRTPRPDMIWVNNNIPGLNGLDVSDLTWLEVDGRRRMRITHDFLKKRMPGFADSFIVDTASQIGVRCGRRLTGEHVVTAEEIYSGVVFPDTIAMGPDFRHGFSPEHPHWHIPYRALLPRRVKNMLAAGRCLSADVIANDLLAPIQYCFATGQAAGTAAALAVKNGVDPGQVDIKKLQKLLTGQNVPLPPEIGVAP
jgi:2-polyprenyl-6-methoxyphenol hydroxylase-like FAD-dependent oxidoreductase